MGFLDSLVSLADRRGGPQPKGKSRLEATVEQRPLTKVDEKAFKAEIWKRDQGHCRCCLRKVIKTISRVPERGEIHHLHGRVGHLLFEARAAVLTCLSCHEKLTGRVNERWTLEPITKGVWWFCATSDGHRLIDARKPLRFVRVI